MFDKASYLFKNAQRIQEGVMKKIGTLLALFFVLFFSFNNTLAVSKENISLLHIEVLLKNNGESPISGLVILEKTEEEIAVQYKKNEFSCVAVMIITPELALKQEIKCEKHKNIKPPPYRKPSGVFALYLKNK